MQIFLSYLGCRLNQAELELWARQFNLAGHSIVNNADEADLMVLNSCAVTQEAVRKSRKNIKQLKRRNPQARVVVSGCFVSLQDETGNRETAQALAVDLVVHNADKQALVEQACRLFDSSVSTAEDTTFAAELSNGPVAATEAGAAPTNLLPAASGLRNLQPRTAPGDQGNLPARWIPLKQIDVTSPANATPHIDSSATGAASQLQLLKPRQNRSRQRAFIKIQDGCRYRCTYCVVTLARGDEISRSIGELVQEVNTLVEEGVKEIVLTGVHVGGYGSDTGESLASLLRALLSETDVPRIRFASVEPWDLEDDLLACLQDVRVMPHMHLPLQSGSDSVLKRMARRCKTADFRRLVDDLQTSNHNFNVTTDIIVGFPGETESEWQQTLDFVNTIAFGHIHVFPFSVRAGTKAARLSGQLTGDIKKSRVRQLRELALKQRQDFLQGCVGREIEVLWERFVLLNGQTGNDSLVSGDTGELANSPESDNSAASSSVARVHGLTPNYIKVSADLPASVTTNRHHSQHGTGPNRDLAGLESSHWVNQITKATIRQILPIPARSENELPDYLLQARIASLSPASEDHPSAEENRQSKLQTT